MLSFAYELHTNEFVKLEVYWKNPKNNVEKQTNWYLISSDLTTKKFFKLNKHLILPHDRDIFHKQFNWLIDELLKFYDTIIYFQQGNHKSMFYDNSNFRPHNFWEMHLAVKDNQIIWHNLSFDKLKIMQFWYFLVYRNDLKDVQQITFYNP